jgi:tetratricopeptide (TPR) repeat protein
MVAAVVMVFAVCMPAAFSSEQAESGAEGVGVAAEKDVVERSLKGQEAIFARDYPGALKIFDALEKDYPESPAGSFGKMAVYEINMLEREDFHLQKKFLAERDKGIKLVNRVLQKYDPSVWDLFLSGSLLGLDGFYKARKGVWWDAYVQGGKSRQLFRRVKKMDPGFIDADFGLGMYLYWRSVFTRDLWFLKMFPDKRNEGIAIVENVVKNGHFARELARVNLAIMYFEEKRFDEAGKLLTDYIARYPNNIVLRRLYGKVLISQKQYDAAVAQFEKTLEIDPELKKPHYFIGAALVLKNDPAGYARAEKELRDFIKTQGGRYWPAYSHYWLGRLEEQRGNKEAAEKEYQKALALEPGIKDAARRVRGMGGGV